jgi:hypothetical protein
MEPLKGSPIQGTGGLPPTQPPYVPPSRLQAMASAANLVAEKALSNVGLLYMEMRNWLMNLFKGWFSQTVSPTSPTRPPEMTPTTPDATATARETEAEIEGTLTAAQPSTEEAAPARSKSILRSLTSSVLSMPLPKLPSREEVFRSTFPLIENFSTYCLTHIIKLNTIVSPAFAQAVIKVESWFRAKIEEKLTQGLLQAEGEVNSAAATLWQALRPEIKKILDKQIDDLLPGIQAINPKVLSEVELLKEELPLIIETEAKKIALAINQPLLFKEVLSTLYEEIQLLVDPTLSTTEDDVFEKTTEIGNKATQFLLSIKNTEEKAPEATIFGFVKTLLRPRKEFPIMNQFMDKWLQPKKIGGKIVETRAATLNKAVTGTLPAATSAALEGILDKADQESMTKILGEASKALRAQTVAIVPLPEGAPQQITEAPLDPAAPGAFEKAKKELIGEVLARINAQEVQESRNAQWYEKPGIALKWGAIRNFLAEQRVEQLLNNVLSIFENKEKTQMFLLRVTDRIIDQLNAQIKPQEITTSPGGDKARPQSSSSEEAAAGLSSGESSEDTRESETPETQRFTSAPLSEEESPRMVSREIVPAQTQETVASTPLTRDADFGQIMGAKVDQLKADAAARTKELRDQASAFKAQAKTEAFNLGQRFIRQFKPPTNP